VSRPDRRARRRAREAKLAHPGAELPLPLRGHGDETSVLHEERLDAVVAALRESGAATVVDLGCGSGSLLLRLALDPRFERIAGADTSARALQTAESRLGAAGATERVELVHASLTDLPPGLTDFDAATLVETIEHIDPGALSQMERAVFGPLRPRVVVVTTPNADYNVLYGMEPGERRHVDHRFEWGRARFARWAGGVAERRGYSVDLRDVGPPDVLHGSPTQLALFRWAG
jgi:small RNA 2'-O-methyltransferase